MAQEIGWWSGDTLAQTVFTCLYLLHPERLEQNSLLRAFCKASKATCSIVREIAQLGNVTREEDFLPQGPGLKLDQPPRDGAAPTVDSLTAAEERLAQAERVASSQQATPSGAASEPSHWEALRCRLRFRRLFIQILYKLHSATRPDYEAVMRLLPAALLELEHMQATQLADPSLRDDYTLGFDLEANRGHLGPAPPRIVTPIPLDKAWSYMRSMLQHLMLVCHLIKVESWQMLQGFLQSFAASQPGTIARSALHYGLTRPRSLGGPWSSTWALDADGMCLAVGLPHSVMSQLPEEVGVFLEQALILAQDYCRCMCLNHARGWDWRPDQGAQGLLGAWVERESAALQAQILLLGFDTQVYAAPDFCMVYWYCDYLFGILHLMSQQLLNSFPQPLQGLHGSSSSKAGSHKGGKKGTKNAKHGKQADQSVVLYNELCTGVLTTGEMAGALRSMSQGCAYMFLGLDMCGWLPTHPCVFNTLRQRYEQRFSFCHRLPVPEPLPHTKYQFAMQSAEGKPAMVFMAAQRAFQSAHAMLMQSEGQLDKEGHLEKIAMKNSLAASLLHRASERAASQDAPLPNFKPSWDFSLHPAFPVVGLKSS
ncbi:hypothetical protein WJX73_006479 [Symbiochloris irregularis]|uniref:Uncharacterized protein n=1 Tax=Symbiochloris irregularis TaxID=706552 RepID=A0AAW1P5Q8_9CHLO